MRSHECLVIRQMVSEAVLIVLCLLICGCSGNEPVTFKRTQKNLQFIENSQVISEIEFFENGARSSNVSSDETEPYCREFQLTEADVRQFFSLARVATEREFLHDLMMSRCFSRGTLAFENGTRTTWWIDRARRGALGNPGNTTYYYCNDCTPSVFMEPCDVDCLEKETLPSR